MITWGNVVVCRHGRTQIREYMGVCGWAREWENGDVGGHGGGGGDAV